MPTSEQVDLRGLAVERDGGGPPLRTRRHLLTRYLLPAALIMGFLALLAWGARGLLFPPRPVMVVPVLSTTSAAQREGTPLFQAAGWIEPRPTAVRVAALAPGVVDKLLVVEDQPVRAGEPIAELVKDDAQLELDRALADLTLREAELDAAVAAEAAAETRYQQPVHLKAALGEAAASLAKVATQLNNLPFETRRAEAEHQALRGDFRGKQSAAGVVAGVEVDIAESKAEAAGAMVEELRQRAASLEQERQALTERRNALRRQLELLADETKAKQATAALVRAAEARLEQARVAVAKARLQRKRMTVVAPIDGRVFRLVADPGASVGRPGGMTAMRGHDGSTVVTLYRPDMLQIRVDVRFEDIPKVQLNQAVEIDNPALPSKLKGKVLFVSSEADIQKNTLQVKVEIADPPPVLKPEMLVDATFLAPRRETEADTASERLRLLVLAQLIHQGEDGAYVWLADQSDGVARQRKVTIAGPAANGLVEVTEGLTAASRIISSGTEQLEDGDRIVVAGEDPVLGTGGPPGGGSEN